MSQYCKFCNKNHAIAPLGDGNDFWYWQPNNTKKQGTHICREKKRQKNRSWEIANPEKAKEKHKRVRNKRRSTPQGRLRHSFSSLMSCRLSGKSNKSTFLVVPYTFEQLKVHLESQFKLGMTWDNYGSGEGKWEVDHIVPDVAFNYNSTHDKQFQDCWALNNLQPMWSKDNKIKNGKS